MSTLKQQYKARKFGWGNTKEGRFLRVENREESRKNRRAKTFNANRNISISEPNSPRNKKAQMVPAVNNRLIRLMKWKVERERRRKLEQMKKKPPFVVGVVRHKIHSPISNQSALQPVTRRMVRNRTVTPASPPKRVTRATEKRLMNKALTKQATNRSPKNKKSVNKKQKRPESFAPADYKFKPPAGLPHMRLFGRVTLQSMSPARISGFISPFVKILKMEEPFITSNKNINTPSSQRSLRRQNAVDKSPKDIENTDLNESKERSQNRMSIYNKERNEHNESIRVLRNRIITSANTPTPSKSPRKMSIDVFESEYNKNKTPSVKTRRNSAKITAENKGKEDLQNSLNVNGDKRRSRRSVKFSEKVNNDSVLNKSTLPMTPHVRRSRTKNNKKKISTSPDLTSWEISEKPPARVKRSRSRRMGSLI
ncbi:uncharacterized protein LOC114874683 [Osmia bicornis bicornis]|uniref:uncharacterized protein LOC114874683 n=1 Tax=Osmia bicornis bicornis TaxID=1437191 RepID=UPI001EAF7516|nr:uncharacterized protein LOC114874683 [Osmia bicornis bicornis]